MIGKAQTVLLVAGLVAGLTAAVAATAAEMTLYESANFGGRHMTVRGNVPNFDNGSFNDRASSMVIRSGFWEVCSDAYFRGNCTRMGPGQYPTLGGMSNNISSVRLAGGAPGPGPNPGPGPGYGPSPGNGPGPGPGYGGGGGAPSIELFERREFGGQSIVLRGNTPDFDPIGFNDRADAAIVRGGTWRLCTDARMRGNCRTFGPGRYNDLGSLGGKVSSAALLR